MHLTVKFPSKLKESYILSVNIMEISTFALKEYSCFPDGLWLGTYAVFDSTIQVCNLSKTNYS